MSPQAHLSFLLYVQYEDFINSFLHFVFMDHHDKLFQVLTQSDDITWYSLITDIVKAEGMDPWDIDVGIITNRYIDTLKKLKEMDFRVSGKVLLASAIMLKIKSNRLVGEDLAALDSLFASTENIDEQAFYDDLENERYIKNRQLTDEEKFRLIPRTPQLRKRKVSIYDLVSALEKALEVKRRRVMSDLPESKIILPKESADISIIIKQIYSKILNFFFKNKRQKLTFNNLLVSNEKTTKIQTFIPLLHLSNQRKVDLQQEVPFGDIEIKLASKDSSEG